MAGGLPGAEAHLTPPSSTSPQPRKRHPHGLLRPSPGPRQAGPPGASTGVGGGCSVQGFCLPLLSLVKPSHTAPVPGLTGTWSCLPPLHQLVTPTAPACHAFCQPCLLPPLLLFKSPSQDNVLPRGQRVCRRSEEKGGNHLGGHLWSKEQDVTTEKGQEGNPQGVPTSPVASTPVAGHVACLGSLSHLLSLR